MKTLGIIVIIMAAGITILKVLYRIGKEMNYFRTCGHSHR